MGAVNSTNKLLDPKYANPALLYPNAGQNNLSLQSTSPAIGYSTAAQYITPPWMVASGACSHVFTSCPAYEALNTVSRIHSFFEVRRNERIEGRP
jgi:hypothetical protein